MAKAPQQPDPAYVDEHHQRIAEFAADYFADDDEEREAFIDTLMERRGYVRRSAWAAPEPQPPTAPDGGQGGSQPAGPGQPKRAPYFRR